MVASSWAHRAIHMAVAGLVWAGCGSSTPVGPREGRLAPAFSVSTIDGGAVEVNGESPRPSVVVFWASWCGPCRRESVEVASLVQSYGDRVQVVSVNSGEDPTKAALTARQWGMDWAVGLDPQGKVSRAYEVDALPLVVVIDRAGMVRYRGNGLPAQPHRLLDGLAG